MLAQPWREIEITLTAENDYPSPYTNVDVWAEFTLDAGITLRRPAFWDGGRVWKPVIVANTDRRLTDTITSIEARDADWIKLKTHSGDWLTTDGGRHWRRQ